MKTDEQMTKEILADAETIRKNKRKKIKALGGVCLLAAAVAAGALIYRHAVAVRPAPVPETQPSAAAQTTAPQQESTAPRQLDYAVAAPALPAQTPFPGYGIVSGDAAAQQAQAEKYNAWLTFRREKAAGAAASYASLLPFLQTTAQKFIGEGDGNRVYSPVNLYIAFSMLSGCASGEAKNQLLTLLGADETLAAANAKALFDRNYVDDGSGKCVLANSLWLNNKLSYRSERINALAAQYYAYVFSGDTAAPQYTEALQNWVNLMTGGLLTEAARGLRLEPETAAALVSTLYFKANWAQQFDEARTLPDVFHAVGGNEEAPFMHESGVQAHYTGKRFTAVELPFENMGSMVFLLPDEGVSPEALLSQDDVWEFLGSRTGVKRKDCLVNLSIPKFDVQSDLELADALQALGVTGIFNADEKPFAALTDGEAAVSRVKHAARVKTDESGCEAAAFTAIMLTGSAMPPEESVDFTLDRPFLFAITGLDGNPLFLGVVQTVA